MPLRRPVQGEIDMTSSFGVRVDPFLSRPAMHTGIDFRGDTGEAIHVTAGGKVASAGWSGGYGRMVEVDHGNGLSTRYGHMSEIDVQVGQTVKAGQTVGRMGSTGRSTGPTFALRDPHQRRGGQPGEVPARRRQVRADLGWPFPPRLRSEVGEGGVGSASAASQEERAPPCPPRRRGGKATLTPPRGLPP